MKKIVLLVILISGLVFFNTEANSEVKTLSFRAKRSSLWLESPVKFGVSNSKNIKSDVILETILDGELFSVPKKIAITDKKNANYNTKEDLISSYFSASKAGDIKWITENFVDDEQSKVRTMLKGKNIIKDYKKHANLMKAEYIAGNVKYKSYTILFIDQYYLNGNIVTEPIVCTETPSGWKLTNVLSDDKTYDIVFAAITSGQVLDNTKKN